MFYGTQGGGKAIYRGGLFVFKEAPPGCNLEKGDEVPEEWGLSGPFNDDGTQVNDDGRSVLEPDYYDDYWE